MRPDTAPLVLVVEDNDGAARLAVEMLREAWGDGFQVTQVERLEGARRALAATQFACVLLDLGLPDGQGLDVVTEVRQAAPGTAIVVLSGEDDDSFAVRAVEEGAQDYLVKGRTDPSQLARAILYAIERKRGEKALIHEATHDPVTRLPNMALLTDRLCMALARLSLSQRGLAVLYVDLDDFKHVNDTLGQKTGSNILAKCADRLRTAVRPADTVARFGGDEYVVLCEEIDVPSEAVYFADRLLAALQPGLPVEGQTIEITASIGVVVCRDGDADPDTIMHSAAEAMYRAKELGGARHVVFDIDMERESHRYREMEIGLRRALPDELEVFYQPVVRAQDELIVGVEALVRWHHPDRGLLLPGAFLDVADRAGMMPEINAWVLQQATRQLAAWQERIPGTQELKMAVNLTPHELRDPRGAARIEEAIRSSGVDPGNIVLEITESALVEDTAQVSETVSALRRLGTILSIDDFGAGYSSIGYIRRFPINALKIDMSLVQSIGRDMRSEALCAAIIEMARALGVKSVAEGVETNEQYAFMRELGVDIVQGFLFSRPVPAGKCEELLSASSTSPSRALLPERKLEEFAGAPHSPGLGRVV